MAFDDVPLWAKVVGGIGLAAGGIAAAVAIFGDRAVGLKQARDQINRIGVQDAVIIVGPPGIGKTELAKTLIPEFDAETRQALDPTQGVVVTVDLNAHEPEDLGGLPIPGKQGFVERQPEEFIHRLSQPILGDTPAVLVLDDLSQAGESMQAAVFRIMLERRAGPSQLGKNVRVIVTANSPRDEAGAQALLSPVTNRAFLIELSPSFDEWVEVFAAPAGIDPRIIGFLGSVGQEFFAQRPQEKDALGRFATPRTWTKLSGAIENIPAGPGSASIIQPLAEGFVGETVGLQFATFVEFSETIPDLNAAITDPNSVDVEGLTAGLSKSEKLGWAWAVSTAIMTHGVKNDFPAGTILNSIEVITEKAVGRNSKAEIVAAVTQLGLTGAGGKQLSLCELVKAIDEAPDQTTAETLLRSFGFSSSEVREVLSEV